MNSGQPSSETARLARAVPIGLVAVACLFNAVAYWSELQVAAPDVNDDVFHFGLIQRMNAAWDAGGNPLDTWIGYWGQGFPVLRYYQHLPHLAVVLAYRLLGGHVPLHTVFDGMTLLLLALMPLTFFVGSRRLGASTLTAACIALCTPLLGADPSQHHYLGFQPRSFLWSGGGLFTQLAAIVLFPLALGATSRAALEGRRFAPAIAWLGATWLSHLVLGYIACLLGVVVLLRPEARGRRWRVMLRLGLVYGGVAVVAAYLLLPTLLEGQWLSRSMWEPPEYWHSYGAQHVLRALVTGGLLDGARIPVLTLLAGLGALVAGRAWLGRHRSADDGFAIVALAMFVLGLLLYFGRPTWGPLMSLLPLSRGLHIERLSNGVQMFAVFLAAVGVGAALRWCLTLEDRRLRWVVSGGVLVLLLAPAGAERVRYIQSSARIVRDGQQRYLTDAAEFAPMLERLRLEPPGRVYGGHSGDWGANYKIGTTPVYQLLSAEGIAHNGNAPFSWPLPTDFQYEFSPWAQASYDLYDVRYVVTDQPWLQPPGRNVIFQSGRHLLYRVATEGPLGLVSVPLTVAGDHESTWYLVKQWTKSGWPSRRAHVRLLFQRDKGGAEPAALRMLDPYRAVSAGVSVDTARNVFDTPGLFDAPPPPAPSGSVAVLSESSQAVSATVEVPALTVLMFKVTYHSGWKASIDGQPAATMLLTPGFVGVEVPAGRHVVRFEYRAGTMKMALLLVGIAVAVALDWRRWRVTQTPPLGAVGRPA